MLNEAVCPAKNRDTSPSPDFAVPANTARLQGFWKKSTLSIMSRGLVTVSLHFLSVFRAFLDDGVDFALVPVFSFAVFFAEATVGFVPVFSVAVFFAVASVGFRL